MMIGKYPCCGGTLAVAMPDEAPPGVSLPAFQREMCPYCATIVWHRLSRVHPKSWTEADFLAEHVIDEERRIVDPKPGTDAARFDQVTRELARKVDAGEITLLEARTLAAVEFAMAP